MEGTTDAEPPMKHYLLPINIRRELNKLNGCPEVIEEKLKDPLSVIVQPLIFSPRQTIASNSSGSSAAAPTNGKSKSVSVELAEDVTVCAWLTCSLCGFLTEEPTVLEEHVKEHAEEEFPLKQIKHEINNESFDGSEELYEEEALKGSGMERQQSALVGINPIPKHGLLKLLESELQQFTNTTINEQTRRGTVHLINCKPFRCIWCTQRSASLRKLNEHMRIHTGERPYRCKTCGYAARNASALSYHIKTHNEARPFPCDLCNYRNTTLSSLRSHKTRIHLKPVSFENLSDSFPN